VWCFVVDRTLCRACSPGHVRTHARVSAAAGQPTWVAAYATYVGAYVREGLRTTGLTLAADVAVPAEGPPEEHQRAVRW
jgi:hypothetical protein